MASDRPLFATGEQVVIIDPGWIWDNLQATVRGVDLPSPECSYQEPHYIVSIDWPDGMRRRYFKWQNQLRADS